MEGKEFEKFKAACANFVSFRKIDDQPYKDTLKKIADANKSAKLGPPVEAFCDELVRAFPKMGDSYYHRAHVRRRIGKPTEAKADYAKAIQLGTNFPDEAQAGIANPGMATSGRQAGGESDAIAAQVVSKGVFASHLKKPAGVSDASWRGVLQRRGNEDVRQKLLKAYGG